MPSGTKEPPAPSLPCCRAAHRNPGQAARRRQGQAGGDLDPPTRRLLVRRCTERTIAAALATGSRVAVVSDDAEISRLARESGAEVIAEPDLAGGLDQAAGSVVAAADGDSWLVCHADLPCSASPTWQPVWRLSSVVTPPSPRHGMAGPTSSAARGVPLLLRGGELPPPPRHCHRPRGCDSDRARLGSRPGGRPADHGAPARRLVARRRVGGGPPPDDRGSTTARHSCPCAVHRRPSRRCRVRRRGHLARWSAAGCEVTMLVVTDGSKGPGTRR